ncbi:MAG: hypothetical protein ABMA00_14140 [Gemmatimonas sp.]
MPSDFHPVHIAALSGDSVVLLARAADFVVLYSPSKGQSYLPITPGLNPVGLLTRGTEHWLIDCCGQRASSLLRPGLSEATLRVTDGMIVGLTQWRSRAFAVVLKRDSVSVQEFGTDSIRGEARISLVLSVNGTGGVLLWSDTNGVYAIERRPPHRVWVIAAGASQGSSYLPPWGKHPELPCHRC